MNYNFTSGSGRAFAALRRFSKGSIEEERCELCAKGLGPSHRHLLEMSTRRIVCSCEACALRFQLVVDGRFKLIPRSARLLADFQLSETTWNNLALPINLAFLLYNRQSKKMVALYPSPAGVTESLLSLSAWEFLVSDNPVLANLEADVQALLINKVDEAGEYYLAPIDTCYGLAGLIRLYWKGLSGGEEVWRHIREFFIRLKSESEPVESIQHEVGHV
jgi:Family of unknown function (DUF5947)